MEFLSSSISATGLIIHKKCIVFRLDHKTSSGICDFIFSNYFNV